METDKKTDGENLQQMDVVKSEEDLSTQVDFIGMADSTIDKYGVAYSKDGTKVLTAEHDIKGSYAIHDGVEVIVDYAFSTCKSMTKISLPDSLTTIGNGAFFRCASLKEITIPKNVTHLTENPFTGLKVHLRSESPYFIVEDDVLYDKHKTRLIAYLSDNDKFIIPNSVKMIGSSAFNSCENLTNITIPDSVKMIGAGAFSSCENLMNITIPDSVEMIEECAFSSCKNLKEISIPKGVTIIDKFTFDGCENLTRVVVPEGVNSIGEYAFEGCKSLKEITISEGVTTIGDNAFRECKSLMDFTIPASVTSMGDNPFSFLKIHLSCKSPHFTLDHDMLYNEAERRLIACVSDDKNIIIPEGITTIGDYAFAGSTKLETIIIPKRLKSIGSKAFSECDDLTEIVIPKGSYAKFSEMLPDYKKYLKEQ